jgi:hypothetical protein
MKMTKMLALIYRNKIKEFTIKLGKKQQTTPEEEEASVLLNTIACLLGE